MVDTGYRQEETIKARLEYLRKLPLEITHILLTHAHIDHMGGAEAFQQETGAPILCHPLEVEAANRFFQQARIGGTLADGQVILGDGRALEAVHTPGHTPGHLCFFLREEGVLFSGDHVPGAGTVAIGPPHGDMAQYLQSLKRLQGLPLRLILPAHGPPVREPARKLRELVAHRQEREEQILGYLKAGHHTAAAMVKEIYPELEERLLSLARGQVWAHLIKLEREGRVKAQGQGEAARYNLT